MPPKRSNKTARVLNLIAKSDNEPSDIEASAQDIINSNNNMSEDAIADLLAKHNDEQTQANEPVSNTETNAVLSDAAVTDLSSQNNQENKSETEQSDIKEQPAQTSAELPPAPQPVVPILQNVREQETQLEEQICSELLSSLEIEEQDTKVQTIPEPLVTNEKSPEPNSQSDHNAVMSDDAIAALLAKNNQEPDNTPEPATQSDPNAVMSDDAITALLAKNNQEPDNTPEPATHSDPNAVMSDDAIAALLAKNNQEPDNTPEPATQSDPNAVMSDDDIAALFAQNNQEPDKVPEPATQSDPNAVMSDDAIAALLTQHNKESEKNNDNPQHVENKVQSTTKTTDNSYIGTAPHGKRSVKYINVIQELVEEEADYSSQMLSCRCPRCLADMKALTLTNLPSKYVVVEDGQKNGLLRIYSSKYSRLISVQIMKSCVIVNENPHH